MSETAEHAGAEQASDNTRNMPVIAVHAVFVVLLILTAVTYFASTIDMGRAINIVVAVGIAVVMASLVAAVFMGLSCDKPFNTVILLVSVGFLALFVGITTLDTSQNHWRKNPAEAEAWMKKERDQYDMGYSEKTDLGGPPPAGGG
jgi:caa(3)-type oxidase subunit IV